MAVARFGFSDSALIAEAVETIAALEVVARSVDVASCEPAQLQALTTGVRRGQAALDRLIIRIGVAADRHDDEGRGRGAHATMLGDGSQIRGRDARREANRARTATDLSKVGRAVDEGRIGAAQVDAIAQAAKELSPEQQQELNSDHLIDEAESLPADVFARRIRDEAERIKGDYGLADTKARQARTSWKHWTDSRSGMGKISAEFDPERYEAIVTAVEAQLTRLANDGGVSKTANLAAEAAFHLLTGKARSSSGLPHISIVVDHQTMSRGPHGGSIRETAGGHLLPPESIRRLACDAVLQRVALDRRGIPVDVGRKHRTATDAQWQALRAIYRTCVWKSCERPLAWCQAHHIHEWEHDGATDLCNLIPLCSQHHHAVHEGGWWVKLGGRRQLQIYDPDRRLWATTLPDRCTADSATARTGRSPRLAFREPGAEP